MRSPALLGLTASKSVHNSINIMRRGRSNPRLMRAFESPNRSDEIIKIMRVNNLEIWVPLLEVQKGQPSVHKIAELTHLLRIYFKQRSDSHQWTRSQIKKFSVSSLPRKPLKRVRLEQGCSDKKSRREMQEQDRPKQAEQTYHERVWGKLCQNDKSRYDVR